jgi:hypothetical protein
MRLLYIYLACTVLLTDEASVYQRESENMGSFRRHRMCSHRKDLFCRRSATACRVVLEVRLSRPHCIFEQLSCILA